MEGKYSIVLFRQGGEGAGIERMLAHHDDLSTARALYNAHVKDNLDRWREVIADKCGPGHLRDESVRW